MGHHEVFAPCAGPRRCNRRPSVITFTEQGTLKAKAFLLTQNLDQLEALDLDEFRVFQVTLGELEKRTQLLFPAALHKGDTLAVPKPWPIGRRWKPRRHPVELGCRRLQRSQPTKSV
ncbi:hypothetical protein ACFY30_37290 [Streptomyces sp. NPDC000345]|uniref:hypothetical protein n=1 Tax=Streptomyces sp. NPDC000345 TaxID=3364537 RepID=UPI00369AA2AF